MKWMARSTRAKSLAASIGITSHPLYLAGETASTRVVDMDVFCPRVLEQALDDNFDFVAVHHVRIQHPVALIVGAQSQEAVAKLPRHPLGIAVGATPFAVDEDRTDVPVWTWAIEGTV